MENIGGVESPLSGNKEKTFVPLALLLGWELIMTGETRDTVFRRGIKGRRSRPGAGQEQARSRS